MKRVCVVLLVMYLMVVFSAGFSDIPDDHWAKEAVETLRQLGLISGFPDNTFRGNETLTRYQVAMLLYNFYKFVESYIKDANAQISSLDRSLKMLSTANDSLSKEIPKIQSRIQNLEEKVNKILMEISDLKKEQSILAKLK